MRNVNKIVRLNQGVATPKTLELRERLKAIMNREIERLPELLEAMEPRDRMAAILRLMPFIFPKVESVRHDRGEQDWNI